MMSAHCRLPRNARLFDQEHQTIYFKKLRALVYGVGDVLANSPILTPYCQPLSWRRIAITFLKSHPRCSTIVLTFPRSSSIILLFINSYPLVNLPLPVFCHSISAVTQPKSLGIFGLGSRRRRHPIILIIRRHMARVHLLFLMTTDAGLNGLHLLEII